MVEGFQTSRGRLGRASFVDVLGGTALPRIMACSIAIAGAGLGPANAADQYFDGGPFSVVGTEIYDFTAVGDVTPLTQLSITGPNVLQSTSGAIGFNATATGSSVTLSGAGLWEMIPGGSGDLSVGYNASKASLSINSSSTVSQTGVAYIGYGAASTANTVSVSGAGSLWTVGGTYYQGFGGGGNTVSVLGGGLISVTNQDAILGFNSGVDSNVLNVDGIGSQFNTGVTRTLYIGLSSSNNELNITNGAVVQVGGMRIGGGTGATGNADSNKVLVDDSILTVNQSLRVGANAAGSGGTDSNSLLQIQNGSQVEVLGNTFVGYSVQSSDNTLRVTGAGSAFGVTGDLTIGRNGSTGNAVIVDDGAQLFSNNIFVTPSNSLTIGEDAKVSAAAYTQTAGATLDTWINGTSTGLVASGNLTLDGGLVATFAPTVPQYVGATYKAISYGGTRSGAFSSTDDNLPDFKVIARYDTPGVVNVTLLPDLVKGETYSFIPSTLVLQDGAVNSVQTSINQVIVPPAVNVSFNVAQGARNELNVFGPGSPDYIDVGSAFKIGQVTATSELNTNTYRQVAGNRLDAVASNNASSGGAQGAINVVNSVNVAPSGTGFIYGYILQETNQLGPLGQPSASMFANNSISALAGSGSATAGIPGSINEQTASNSINSATITPPTGSVVASVGINQSLGGAGTYIGSPPPDEFLSGIEVSATNSAVAVNTGLSTIKNATVTGIEQGAFYNANMITSPVTRPVDFGLAGSQNGTVRSFIEIGNVASAASGAGSAIVSDVSQEGGIRVNTVVSQATGNLYAGTANAPFIQIVQPSSHMEFTSTPGDPSATMLTMNELIATSTLGSASIAGGSYSSVIAPTAAQTANYSVNTLLTNATVVSRVASPTTSFGGVDQIANDTRPPTILNLATATSGAGSASILNLVQSQSQSINAFAASGTGFLGVPSTTINQTIVDVPSLTAGALPTTLNAVNRQTATGATTALINGSAQSTSLLLNSAGLGVGVNTNLNQTIGASTLTSSNVMTATGTSMAAITNVSQQSVIGVNTGSATSLLGGSVTQTVGLTTLNATNTLNAVTGFNASVNGVQMSSTSINTIK